MSQTIAPDMTDSFDSSIPVLTDVIVPGRPERARAAPHAPEPVLAFVPPVVGSAESAGTAEHQADVIADRLRGRFTHFLTGDGRTLIEERCRESLQEHSNWLVSQITREVALALETELTEWVREAVVEELGRKGPAV
jgi:hypothetical protein